MLHGIVVSLIGCALTYLSNYALLLYNEAFYLLNLRSKANLSTGVKVSVIRVKQGK